MVVDGGLITRLIERVEFLLQITLPPGIISMSSPRGLDRGWRQLAARRGEVYFARHACRSAHPGHQFFYAAGASSGRAAGNERPRISRQRRSRRRRDRAPAAVVWWAGRAWVYRRSLRTASAGTRFQPTCRPRRKPGSSFRRACSTRASTSSRPAAQLRQRSSARKSRSAGDDHAAAAECPMRTAAFRPPSSVLPSASVASSSRSHSCCLATAPFAHAGEVRRLSRVRPAAGWYPGRGARTDGRAGRGAGHAPIENAVNGVPGVDLFARCRSRACPLSPSSFRPTPISTAIAKWFPNVWRKRPRSCRPTSRRRPLRRSPRPRAPCWCSG